MNEPFNHGGFSRRGGDWGGSNIWEAMEQLRSSFNPKQPFRMNRGDVRAGILHIAGRGPDARLPDHPRDRRTQRRQLEAQPGVGLPDAAAAHR